MSLLRDLAFAARSLRRSPGYTLTFVATLALGLGATTAIFSVIDGVLLRPLPYADGESVVYLRQGLERAGVDNALFSVAEIEDYRRQVTALAGVAEFSAMTFTMLGNDDPRRVRAGVVTGNYFEVLGLTTVLGRPLAEADDPETSDPVAVLTHDFWLREFGGDPGVIGRTMTMGPASVVIVGVAAAAPPYPERTDLYVNMVTSPHHMSASMNHDRRHRMTEVLARLAPGAGLDGVRGQVRAVSDRIHAEYPEAYDPAQGHTVSVTPLRDQLAERARPTMAMLLGAAVFVLLVACANVANLTLTRARQRREEMSMRAALGASSRRLRRQLLAEALLPSALGGLLGLGLGIAGLDLLVSYASRFSVRSDEIAFDLRTFGFASAVVVVAACLFALAPRLPAAALGTMRGASSGARGRRAQQLLAVTQIAVSFVLLIGAGLLLRSLLRLEAVEPGVDTENVVTMELPGSFPGLDDDQRLAAYQEMTDRLLALPGVREVALSTAVPLNVPRDGVRGAFEVRVEGHEPQPGEPLTRVDFRAVSTSWFDTVGARVVAGRALDARDSRDAAAAVMLNETAARRLFPDEDPVGKRVAWTGDVLRFVGLHDDWRTVVGVVADAQDFGVGIDPPPAMFHSLAQETVASALFLRTAGLPSSAVVESAVDVIRTLAPEQPIENVATLEQLRDESLAPQRLNARLVGLLALTGVAIAAVGIGAVLAFNVSQRRRELGIRAALGADRGRLLRSVLAEGGAMAAIGIAAGGLLAVWAERLLGSLLYEVGATDPTTFVATATVLALVAIGSAAIPGRRAARADPAIVLRAE